MLTTAHDNHKMFRAQYDEPMSTMMSNRRPSSVQRELFPKFQGATFSDPRIGDILEGNCSDSYSDLPDLISDTDSDLPELEPVSADLSRLGPVKLRRQQAITGIKIDDYMFSLGCNLSCPSNADIVSSSRGLARGKFRHPRSRQMAAAARYGWKFTPMDAKHPENWRDAIYLWSMIGCKEFTGSSPILYRSLY